MSKYILNYFRKFITIYLVIYYEGEISLKPMKWVGCLNNFKWITKLIILLFVFVVLLSFEIGISIKTASRMNGALTNIYNTNIKCVERLYAVSLQLKDLKILARDYLNINDKEHAGERAAMEKLAEQKQQQITMNINEYRKTDLSAEEREALRKFDQMVAEYKKVIATTIEYSNTKGYKETKDYVYGYAAQVSNKITDEINNMINLCETNARQTYNNNRYMYDLERKILIIVGSLGMLLTLGLCLLITFSVSEVINKFMKAMNQAEHGDLTTTLDINSKNEIGTLANGFRDVLKSQREIIRKVADTSESVSKVSEEISGTTQELASTTQTQVSIINDFTELVGKDNTKIQDITNNMFNLVVNINDVSKAITDMGDSIQETSKNIEAAVSYINEVTASVEQMDDSINIISKHAKGVEIEAKNTVLKAQEGNVAVNNTINEMDNISKSVGELSTAIKELGVSASQIGEFVSLIEDIAEQTNLLSLNAAIEAARAGESGKGFAVVANSIRGLAEKCAEATKDIARIIKNIQTGVDNAINITNDSTGRVQEGVNYVTSTGLIFEGIFKAINTTNSLIQEITTSIEGQEAQSKEIIIVADKMNQFISQLSATSEEQASGAEGIVEAVGRINNLTHEMAASIVEKAEDSQEILKLIQNINRSTMDVSNASEQIAAAIASLVEQTREVLVAVSAFKIK